MAGREAWTPNVTSGSSISNASVARRSALSSTDVYKPSDVRVDVGVGRDDQHHLVVGLVDGDRGEGDGGGGVAAHRLEQDVRVRQLVADEALVAAFGDDGDVVVRRAAAAPSPGAASPRSAAAAGRASGVPAGSEGGVVVPPPPAMMTAYMRRPS